MKNHDKQNINDKDSKDNEVYIFRPWITKNGKKIYAKEYGLKAFKIKVN